MIKNRSKSFSFNFFIVVQEENLKHETIKEEKTDYESTKSIAAQIIKRRLKTNKSIHMTLMSIFLFFFLAFCVVCHPQKHYCKFILKPKICFRGHSLRDGATKRLTS